MNERIKELSLQASDSISDDVSAEQAMYLFQKKFAELLIKECAGIYSKIDNGNSHLGTDDYLTALVKHFGVEE